MGSHSLIVTHVVPCRIFRTLALASLAALLAADVINYWLVCQQKVNLRSRQTAPVPPALDLDESEEEVSWVDEVGELAASLLACARAPRCAIESTARKCSASSLVICIFVFLASVSDMVLMQ